MVRRLVASFIWVGIAVVSSAAVAQEPSRGFTLTYDQVMRGNVLIARFDPPALQLINRSSGTKPVMLREMQLTVAQTTELSQFTSGTEIRGLRKEYFGDYLDGFSLTLELVGPAQTIHVMNACVPELLPFIKRLDAILLAARRFNYGALCQAFPEADEGG